MLKFRMFPHILYLTCNYKHNFKLLFLKLLHTNEYVEQHVAENACPALNPVDLDLRLCFPSLFF
jgi:hypothetical protein